MKTNISFVQAAAIFSNLRCILYCLCLCYLFKLNIFRAFERSIVGGAHCSCSTARGRNKEDTTRTRVYTHVLGGKRSNVSDVRLFGFGLIFLYKTLPEFLPVTAFSGAQVSLVYVWFKGLFSVFTVSPDKDNCEVDSLLHAVAH